jgi:mycoredoxin
MLNVYAASWCRHCQKTVEFLEENKIAFNYIDVETQPDDVVAKVVEVNGGFDWVVPTFEFNGKWRKGKVFDPRELTKDLVELGVIQK